MSKVLDQVNQLLEQAEAAQAAYQRALEKYNRLTSDHKRLADAVPMAQQALDNVRSVIDVAKADAAGCREWLASNAGNEFFQHQLQSTTANLVYADATAKELTALLPVYKERLQQATDELAAFLKANPKIELPAVPTMESRHAAMRQVVGQRN